MELTLPDLPETAVQMFEAGASSTRVAIALRIKKSDALAMKKAWLDAKAPAADKPAKSKKAKAAE